MEQQPAKYHITIKQVETYPEKDYRYEGNDGNIYESEYRVPEGVKAKKIAYETGQMLDREVTVYTQQFVTDDLTDIIRAVNNID